MLRFDFGMRCGVSLVGFGVEIGFGLVVFVEFLLLDINHSVFDHFLRFVMVVNIFVERSEATERRNVILFGAERGCFALCFGNVLGESGGFFFCKFMVPGISMAGKRFGFRFGFEVGDFCLGIIASGESLVRFVAGLCIRFGPLGSGGAWLQRLFSVAFSHGLFMTGFASLPFRD